MTPETVAVMQQVATDRLIVHNFKEILRAAVNQTVTETEERLKKQYANPSPVVAGDTPAPAGETPQDRMARQAMARLTPQLRQ